MKKLLNTLYHDSTKNYVSNPYPTRGEKIEIKIRVKKNNLITGIFIRYRKLGSEMIEKMQFDYEKNGLEYYKIKVECLDDVLSYYFNIATKDELYFYNQRQITNYRPDNSLNFKIIVDYKAPKWLANTVFYQIMPDRFRNAKDELTVKDGAYEYQGWKPFRMQWNDIPYEWEKTHCLDFYGGDLYGIIEKLDYLQVLGVNAIYLNPIFKSPTMHRYDALDYFEVDKNLGGDEALEKLCKMIHQRGMRIILDISINHTSSSAKWFNKDGLFYDKSIGAYNNPDSPYREFYYIKDDGTYKAWAGVDTMPQLNYSSEKLRKIIYKDDDSVLKKYLKAPFNIDGWRFDVADVMARTEEDDIYYEVWEEICSEIKSVNSEALILAEEWQDAEEMFNGKRWDSTMNYFASNFPIREFAGERDIFTIRNEELSKVFYKTDAQILKNRIKQFYDKLPSQIQYQMFNLIDSHDIHRLYNNKKIERDVYIGALITLFGIPGATNIYYGDEKYLDGRDDSVEGARYPMDWSETLPNDKQEIFDINKKLIELKTKHEAYGYGGFKIVFAQNDVFAFARFNEDELFISAWTRSSEKETIKIDLSQFGLFDEFIFEVGRAKLVLEGKELAIELNAKESIILMIK